jgi:Zn-dependent peptidase ImmA (M78 family)
MRLSFHKLLDTLPELNKKNHTPEDFWQVCGEKKIIVRERPFRKKGYYVPDLVAGDCIFINSRLKNYRWLEVALHEMFHALLHFPSPFLAGKQQFEANAFTVMALCPLAQLDAGSEMRALARENHEIRFILRERERLYFFYNDFGIGAA